ncbi:hypothetical protein PSACC_01587 [Paramicrosporidium saccamoebae]|uniref:RING-type E3 ubiquitin transferase n=1 Tax=Paramicrosporidium saccamoebae TaxID=1246581 RepID=A0A2H9TLJ4_9FUNG|nr:hypothetical protein PSACC_01587 [Paramicrosporidium saccamoebae]
MKEVRFKRRMMKQFLLDATICAFQERRATLPRPNTIRVEEDALNFDDNSNMENSLLESPSISLKGIFAHFKKTSAVTIKHKKPTYECVPFSDGKIFDSQSYKDCPRSIMEPPDERDKRGKEDERDGRDERDGKDGKDERDGKDDHVQSFRCQPDAPVKSSRRCPDDQSMSSLQDALSISMGIEIDSFEGLREKQESFLFRSAANQADLMVADTAHDHSAPGTQSYFPSDLAVEICRVCRGEATNDQPLFYPCLCSGSIKYVHQECLLEWLKHSKKKYCELCKHPYSFSPVYEELMPARLPISVISLGLARQFFGILRIGLRYVYLSAIWLVLVPTITTSTLCLYLGWGMVGLKELSLVTAIFNVGVGLGITSVMVLLLMSLLLLRDYMLTHRLLRVRRRRRANGMGMGVGVGAGAGVDVGINEGGNGEMNRDANREANGEVNREANREANGQEPGDANRRENERELADEATGIDENSAIGIHRNNNPTMGIYRNNDPTTEIYRNKNQTAGIRRNDNLPTGIHSSDNPTAEIHNSVNLTAETHNSDNPTTEIHNNTRPATGIYRNGNPIAEIYRSENSVTEIHHNGNSETTARTFVTRQSERSYWLQNVVPREYRAYLRRRDLYRERNLRGSHSHLDADTSALTSRPQAVENAAVASSSITNSNVEEGGTFHRRNNGLREHNRGETSHIAGSSTLNVTFRDNIRCKICSSVVCIDKEHVVLASQRTRQQEATSGAEPEEGQGTTTDPLPVAPVADIPPPPRRVEDAAVEANQWNFLGMNFEGDNGAAMTLSEFIGLTGSLLSVIQNAFVIISCNVMVLHSAVFVPQMVGKAVLKGELPLWLSNGISFIESTIFNVATSESDVTKVYPLAKNALAAIVSHGKPAITSLSMIPDYLITLLPNNFQGLLSERLATIGTNARLATTLFSYSEGYYMDFILQLFAGYLAILCTCGVYRLLVIDNMRKLDDLHRGLLQMFQLFSSYLKLVFFMMIELIAFPIYCGWMVDLSSLNMFASNFAGRIGFYNSYPFSSQLIHWSVGTIFLIQVSVMIKWYRSVFRPGLLYFIRNSDDPDNLPLKEVVERSVHDQLLRFVNSLILFGIVIVCHIYGFSVMCQLFVPNLIPLNISFRNYTAEVPYDLFGNLFAKVLVDFLNPGTIGKLSRAFMRSVLKLLRLSSYFYGGRYLYEESLTTGKWVFVPDAERVYKAEKVRDMFQRRVEPLDIAKIPVVEGRDPSTVPIAPTVPVEPRRPRRVGAGRRAEDPTKGFTVVYRPNNCAARVYLFLFTEWLYYQLVGMLLVATPILIGRYIFGLFLTDGTKAHEMHTFMAGFMVMGVLMKTVQLTYNVLCDGGLVNVLKTSIRVPVIALKAAIVGVFISFLWPTMIGAYLMLILSPLLSSVNETPILPLFTCWFIGFMYIKVFYTVRDVLCSTERVQILDRLATLEGWTDMQFMQVMLRVVLPYTMRLVTLIVGPPLAVVLLAPLIDLDFVQMLIIGRWSYLLSLAVPAVVLGVGLISNLRQSMAMRIRDDNYLVGRRLHNLERPPSQPRFP